MPTQNEMHRRRIIRQYSGFVYVVQFSTGLLKVGQSSNVVTRLKQHRDAARRQHQEIAESWSSPRHTTFSENEDRLISFCLKQYGPAAHGKETFDRANFAEVVAYAKSLAFPALTDEAIASRMRNEDNREEIRQLDFHARQVAALKVEVDLINSLANENNRWATHDAHLSVAERLMRLKPAAWHVDDRGAVYDYLAVKTGRPVDRPKAHDFEISFRALFVMDLKREAETFAELAEYIESYEVSK